MQGSLEKINRHVREFCVVFGTLSNPLQDNIEQMADKLQLNGQNHLHIGDIRES